MHISGEVDPELLKEGEKAGALIMNNQFKAKNRSKIQEWFSLFGTQFG